MRMAVRCSVSRASFAAALLLALPLEACEPRPLLPPTGRFDVACMKERKENLPLILSFSELFRRQLQRGYVVQPGKHSDLPPLPPLPCAW